LYFDHLFGADLVESGLPVPGDPGTPVHRTEDPSTNNPMEFGESKIVGMAGKLECHQKIMVNWSRNGRWAGLQ